MSTLGNLTNSWPHSIKIPTKDSQLECSAVVVFVERFLNYSGSVAVTKTAVQLLLITILRVGHYIFISMVILDHILDVGQKFWIYLYLTSNISSFCLSILDLWVVILDLRVGHYASPNLPLISEFYFTEIP